jgi:hypothetical protein
MAVTAEQHARIRSGPAYRAALWVLRLQLLGMLTFGALLLCGGLATHPAGAFVFVGALIAVSWVSWALQVGALRGVAGPRDYLFDHREGRRFWRDAVLHWR